MVASFIMTVFIPRLVLFLSLTFLWAVCLSQKWITFTTVKDPGSYQKWQTILRLPIINVGHFRYVLWNKKIIKKSTSTQTIKVRLTLFYHIKMYLSYINCRCKFLQLMFPVLDHYPFVYLTWSLTCLPDLINDLCT